VPAGTGIVCLTRTYYVNVPATIRGAEFEYTLNPIDNLTINGSVGWSKFTSPDIAARAVNRRQGTPFWTANAGIAYEIPVTALQGSITPRVDWAYQSSEVISGTSTKYNALNGARSIVNARVTYENEEYDFTVAAGVTNLFDKFYYLNWFDYQAFGRPNTQAQPGAPQQWYLTVSKRF
jgi:iron complex outermembrane receptor protein